MSTQDVLLGMGWASFFAAGFATLGTARYYVTRNVRGVRDDLAGRRRMERAVDMPGGAALEASGSDESVQHDEQHGELGLVTEVALADALACEPTQLGTAEDRAMDAGFVIVRDVVIGDADAFVGRGGDLEWSV